MEDVKDWFKYYNSAKLEEQVKCCIAKSCEAGINVYYDEPETEPMTMSEWHDYIIMSIKEGYGEQELKHLKFYGKAKTEKLIYYFIANYDSCIQHIKKEN